MTPADDATWPTCAIHNRSHWCEWTRDLLITGGDSATILPLLRICVPVAPNYSIYAEVSIGDVVIPDLAWELSLVVSAPGWLSNEEFTSLGLWSHGEGRLVISSALADWADGHADPTCVASTHGFSEEMKHQAAIKSDVENMYHKANRWCLAYHKRCYQCHSVAQAKSNTSSVVNFDASSFGLDFVAQPGRGAASNGRQERALDALRNRYTKRVLSGEDPTPLGSNAWPSGGFI